MNFTLKHKDKTLSQIYLDAHYDTRFRWYTGKRIKKTEWSKKNKNGKGPIYNSFNAELARIKKIAQEAEHQLTMRGIITKKAMEFILNSDSLWKAENYIDEIKELIPKIGKDKYSFHQAFEEYIEVSKTTKTTSTINQIRTKFENLKAFEKHTGENIELDKIDMSLYDKLLKYYYEERNMSNNSVGNQIKTLKSFLNFLIKRGYKIDYNLKNFKVFKESVHIIYHSQEEVDKLFNMVIPSNEDLEIHKKDWNRLVSNSRTLPDRYTLEQARDIHVLECQTSLRVSDRKRLGKEHIVGNTIKMDAYKNKKRLIIPLTPKAKFILEKYKYQLPFIHEQRMNEYVKILSLIAGFTYTVEIVEYAKGEKIFTKLPKWKLITNHTAVKTFITHCGEKGISSKVVSEITGKTVKVIQDHYYGTNESMIQSEMERAFGV